MNLSMDLWHSNNMKVILLKFVKNHCFWTFWTLNYVDCIPFHSIDSFHIVHNQAKQFKKILFSNFRKVWSNLHLYGSGPIKSVLFICPSLCLSICDAFFLGSTQWIFFNFLHEDVLPYILKCDKAKNQKRNIWHFNGGSITFCVLNDASWLAIWFCENCMSRENLVLKLQAKMLSTN